MTDSIDQDRVGGPADGEDTGEPRDPSVVERIFGNRMVLMVLLVTLLGWLAFAHVWVFVGVVGFIAFIFLHEMGHFLMAKRNGMMVTEFFLGFGPRIWSFTRGETEYGLKLVPAGAYVRIIGMHGLEEVDPADEPRTYRAQGYWKRMPVVLAGPAVNLALGFFLLVVVFAGFGHPSGDKWKVSSVSDASAAAAAGIQPGDRIVGFGGQSVASFDDFTSVVRAHAGTTVDLTVERDGQTIVVPATIGWSLNADGARALAPLAAGDRVTAVGDTPISSYSDLVAATQRVIGPMVITFDRSGRSFTTTLDGPVAMPIDGAKGFLGVGPASVLVRAGIVQATGQAATGFADVVVGSVQGIGRVFSPSGLGRLASQVANGGSSETDAKSASTSSIQPIDGGSTSVTSSSGSSSNLDRPLSAIGIVSVIQQLGESGGWEPVLLILATVSIFLGLINLVPLLPFDGGHIAVATYEEVRGRLARKSYRANINKLIPVTYVVLFVMVCLFLSTSFLDTVAPPKINP